jgi:predicted O-linked N-acetylglucosamine transferase (SPINDLY family)
MGLDSLVATSPAKYVHAAVGLARSPSALAETRHGLRERMLDSVLVDQESFARHIEAAYRHMWRRYCETG